MPPLRLFIYNIQKYATKSNVIFSFCHILLILQLKEHFVRYFTKSSRYGVKISNIRQPSSKAVRPCGSFASA